MTNPAQLCVASPAFAEGVAIPERYTGDGVNVSPPLAWSPVPASTQSLAVLVEDPDAPGGTWLHWLLFNLPPTTSGLPEHMPPVAVLPDGAMQGINDFHRIGYGGPRPPPGKAHRYLFTVFALDVRLDLNVSVSRADFLQRIRGHILAQGTLTGTFRRGQP